MSHPPQDEPVGRGPRPERTPQAGLESTCTAAPTPAPRFPEAQAEPDLRPGDLLAGRFRVVRFIDRGGMGDVYEALDLELGEPVALKTVHGEVALAPERLRREVRLARRVTHPNVCRLFDLYPAASVMRDGNALAPLTFLTMELLRGETLAERLARDGPLEPSRAAALLVQIAAALDAAHRAGVVHRDLKSRNVMLIDEEGAPVRAVVTDFGLAEAPRAGDRSVTAPSALHGTPAYMAPEQVSGEKASSAWDIYALGVVLYEMVTGTRPFHGDTPWAVAVKRLTEAPPPPRQLAPDLDPRWERVILRCLERDPRARYPRASDAVRELEEDHPLRRRGSRRWLPVAALGLLLALAGAGWLGRSSAPDAPGPGHRRRAVAVLGFRNLSGRADAEWMSSALAQMLATELAASGNLRSISGEEVARARIELGLRPGEDPGPGALEGFHAVLGADLLVLGSYLQTGGPEGRIRLDLRVQDATRGEAVASAAEEGSADAFLDLVSRTGTRLRASLGIVAPGARPDYLQAYLPGNPAVLRLYAEGTAYLHQLDAPRARELLEQAVGQEPGFALAQAALAEAWRSLGHEGKAMETARLALEHSAGLPRELRLDIEGRSHLIAHDWAEAIRAYQALWTFFPDNLEYGLALVDGMIYAERLADARMVLGALEALPEPMGTDPRIALAAARIGGRSGSWEDQRQAAVRAATAARARGARLLLARARLSEGGALRLLGRSDEAREAFQEARRLWAEAGDRANEAQAAFHLGVVAEEAGHLEAARRLYEEAQVVFQATGRAVSVARLGQALASVLLQHGDLMGARSKLEEALRGFQAVRVERPTADCRGELGALLGHMGLLAESRRELEAAHATYQDSDDGTGMAWIAIHLAPVLAHQGEFGEARARLEAAVAFLDGTGAARLAAEARLALAALEASSGRGRESGEIARAALEKLETVRSLPGQALAHALIARAARSTGGDPTAARTAVASALGLAHRSGQVRARLEATIAAALVEAAEPDADGGPALASLREAIREAEHLGFVILALEARLALAEAETAAGRHQAARTERTRVRREADARGLRWLARRAAAL